MPSVTIVSLRRPGGMISPERAAAVAEAVDSLNEIVGPSDLPVARECVIAGWLHEDVWEQAGVEIEPRYCECCESVIGQHRRPIWRPVKRLFTDAKIAGVFCSTPAQVFKAAIQAGAATPRRTSEHPLYRG